ncbi:MAG: isochorismate synthase [Proteobacteria bacterium]|nr:isochorismate synthase [Pseudomonadota bacterium]
MTSTPDRSLERARPVVEASVREAERTGAPRFVAWRRRVAVDVDLVALFAQTPAVARAFHQSPGGSSWVASGLVAELRADGPARFRTLATGARRLFEGLRVAGDPAPPGVGPLLVGGFGFTETAVDAGTWREFPAARFVLPEVLWTRQKNGTLLTLAARIDPGATVDSGLASLAASERDALRALEAGGAAASSDGDGTPRYEIEADRSHDAFRAVVEEALSSIAAGDFEKVVLARSLCVRSRRDFDVAQVLAELVRVHPACTTFAFGFGGDTFLGATPERLVKLSGTRVETGAVAGSAPRGTDPDADVRLGRELRESKKEQAEHAVVVRAIRDSLFDVCGELEGPAVPSLVRFDGIQHLATPLRGRLQSEARGVVDLVERLHPTPAVAGAPRDRALAFLREREGLDRGWYAAPVGFVDATLGGEFVVALRSALVRESEAHLFAGAGVVAGSCPARELAETRLKLRALLLPLTTF